MLNPLEAQKLQEAIEMLTDVDDCHIMATEKRRMDEEPLCVTTLAIRQDDWVKIGVALKLATGKLNMIKNSQR